MKLRLINDIVAGMDHLHTRDPPVIHSDLKLQNVLVDNTLRAKVCTHFLFIYLLFIYPPTIPRSADGHMAGCQLSTYLLSSTKIFDDVKIMKQYLVVNKQAC